MSVKCIAPHSPLSYSKTGVSCGIHILVKQIDCGYSLEPPQRTYIYLCCFENEVKVNVASL